MIPNPYQPRSQIDEGALVELTASIEASGLLQPVIVRPRNGKFELIAGERRWRAIQRLGWAKIPAVVKDVDDQTLLTLALIENLQRDDLSLDRRGRRVISGWARSSTCPRPKSRGWWGEIGRRSPTCFGC